MAMRWTHITYASFRGKAGSGGWKVGSWSTHAEKEDLQLISEVAPTNIETVAVFDDFISSEDIDALPRRFEYRPMQDRSLIMQSVPAGKDATGRPGNVFTHALIDNDLDSPLTSVYPIALYRSEDLLTPFRVAAVNAAELPADLGEPKTGPMADLSLAWMMVDSMFGDRRHAFYHLQDVLQAGDKTAILVLNSTNEAAYWIQALSSTLTPNEARRLLHYSTFERAATLPVPDKAMEASSLFVVPRSDRELLGDRPGIVIIDPEQPSENAVVGRGSWSRMTAGLYSAGSDPDELVASLIRANDNLDSSQTELAGFGDGLARLIRTTVNAGDDSLRKVADQHLFGEIRDGSTPRSSTVAPEPDPVDVRVRASEVIHEPRRAIESQEWTSLRRRAESRRWIGNMSEQAINNIEKLHDSPAKELVSYLDFLLKTELITDITTADPHFRSSFADFPAMENWRKVPFSGGEHPRLKELLIDAERDARTSPRSGIILDQVMPHLNRERSLSQISSWLDSAEAQRIIAGINGGVRIQTGRNLFMWDLLRVYFGIALTTPDDEDYRALTTLAVDAVNRYVVSIRKTGGVASLRTFEKFAERFVRDDAPEFLNSSSEIRQYLDILEHDVEIPRLSRDKDVNMIFQTVAEAIVRAVYGTTTKRETLR